MIEKHELSNQSKGFLDNLRLYLFSSGKKSSEIQEIVEELEVHLYEAEQEGKPIEKIIGKSPKEYMGMVSNEMPIDYASWIKYILLIVIGSFSFNVLPDALNGNLAYSVLEIGGHIAIAAIFIASIFIGFKYISTTNPSFKKQIFILVPIMMTPILLFVGLIYLNQIVEMPIIYAGNIASMIIGLITVLFLIGLSIWAKTWLLLFVISLFILPEYGLRLTTLEYETRLIISALIPFLGMVIYLWILYRIEKK